MQIIIKISYMLLISDKSPGYMYLYLEVTTAIKLLPWVAFNGGQFKSYVSSP